jgi:hypothetical protein
MTDIIAVAEVGTTAFLYNGNLDYNTDYFWRVTALSPVPSDPGATFSFTTKSAPQQIAESAEEQSPVKPQTVPQIATIPSWTWIIVAIGSILIIAVLVLLFRLRKG